jgi:hypothetical protein
MILRNKEKLHSSFIWIFVLLIIRTTTTKARIAYNNIFSYYFSVCLILIICGIKLIKKTKMDYQKMKMKQARRKWRRENKSIK